jgi:hypothetical protein
MLHSKQLLVAGQEIVCRNTDASIASTSCLIEAPTVKRLMGSRSYVCPSALLTDMPSEHLHRTRAIRMMLFHASAGFRRKSELLGNPASYTVFLAWMPDGHGY